MGGIGSCLMVLGMQIQSETFTRIGLILAAPLLLLVAFALLVIIPWLIVLRIRQK